MKNLLLFISCFIFIPLAGAADVEFIADTDIELTDIVSGGLTVASGSECAWYEVNSTTFSVGDVTTGSSFVLKTPTASNALSLTPAGSPVGFSVTNSGLKSGLVDEWILNAGTATGVAHVMQVEEANMPYEVKIDGSKVFDVTSDANSEIVFNYVDGGDAKVFTIGALDALCNNFATMTFFGETNYYQTAYLTALSFAKNKYYYFDCEKREFVSGNDVGEKIAIAEPASYLEDSIFITLENSQAGAAGINYYNKGTKIFKKGVSDGSLIAVSAINKMTEAAILLLTNQTDSLYFYATDSKKYYVINDSGVAEEFLK